MRSTSAATVFSRRAGSPQAASRNVLAKHRIGDVGLPSRRDRLAKVSDDELIKQHAERRTRRTPP